PCAACVAGLPQPTGLRRARPGARDQGSLTTVDSDLGPTDVIEHLGLRLDRARKTARAGDLPLHLTGTEFRLLECMLRTPGQTFTRAELVHASIAGGAVVLERTIDVHVSALRRKLGAADVIETVRGVGYRCRDSRG